MDLLHKFSFLSKKGLDNRSICEYDTSHKAKALWRIFSEVPFFVLKNTFCRTKRFVRQNTEMYNAYPTVERRFDLCQKVFLKFTAAWFLTTK